MTQPRFIKSSTAAELPAAMINNGHDIRVLVQYVRDWHHSPNPIQTLAETGPVERTDEATITAALVHALSEQDSLTTPLWVHDHHSNHPLTISATNLNTRYGQHITANTPPTAATHNVYFHTELLHPKPTG